MDKLVHIHRIRRFDPAPWRTLHPVSGDLYFQQNQNAAAGWDCDLLWAGAVYCLPSARFEREL